MKNSLDHSINDADLVGKKFTRWTVLSFSHVSKWRQRIYLCKCDCGESGLVRGASLRSGISGSCGCLHHEIELTSGLKHGHSRDGSGSTYYSWMAMNNRCHCTSNTEYHHYGGRGISVCERWQGKEGFANFLSDMGERPSPKHSLDRYPDMNGSYQPSNCRWATGIQQHRNKRTSVFVTINNETKCLIEWYEVYKMNASTVRQRVKRGMSWHEALTMPISNRIDNLKNKTV